MYYESNTSFLHDLKFHNIDFITDNIFNQLLQKTFLSPYRVKNNNINIKLKSISKMSLKEIKQLLEDYKIIDCTITNIENKNNNLIVDFKIKKFNGIIINDKVNLTSKSINDINNFFTDNDKINYKYNQYMIAKGYSEYWKNNPYIYDI